MEKYNLIPVCPEILEDWEHPVSLQKEMELR